MKDSEFAEQMGKIETEFGRHYSQTTLEIMWARLKYYPLQAVREAVDSLILEEKFIPKYNEIHGAIKRVMGARGWREVVVRPTGEAAFKCVLCEDTGIKLRRYRANLVSDFYCVCAVGESLPKLDWENIIWRDMVEKKVGTKDFADGLGTACRASGISRNITEITDLMGRKS